MKHALRSLAKSPGSTAVALVTHALGIGANTTMFSVLRTVTVRTLPFADGDRLTIGAAALSVVLAGLLPAWFASRANPIDAMKAGGRSHTSRAINRLTRGLVVAQIALTCALLVASLLLVRSILNQQRQSLGYDGAAVLTTRINLETDFRNTAELRTFYPQLLAGLRASPDVTHAALTSRRNLVNTNTTSFEIDGQPPRTERERPTTLRDVVSDGGAARGIAISDKL